MDSMVDWDLAASLGSRLAGQGPTVTADEAAAAVAELRAAADRSTGPGPRLHRTGGRGAYGAGAGRRPARLGAGQHRRVRGHARRRSSTSCTEKKGAPTGVAQAVGVPGHRHRGRAAAGLPRVQGARPVRPVPRAVRPAAARRPQRRPRRAGAEGRPRRTSGSGSASTRRPTGSSSPPSRGCATTCSPRSPRSPTPSTRAGMLEDGVKRVSEARPRRRHRQRPRRARARRSRRRSSTGSPA